MAILVLASVGVNGADGPDLSWITSLMSPEERLLGLPVLNMIGARRRRRCVTPLRPRGRGRSWGDMSSQAALSQAACACPCA